MTDKQFAAGYEVGFRDGFKAACDECWAKGYDAGTKALAEEEVRER